MSTAINPDSKTLSITSLIVGIVSLAAGFTLIVPIAGIVLGVMAKRREPTGTVLANWGIWLSVAAIVLGIVVLVLFGSVLLLVLGIRV